MTDPVDLRVIRLPKGSTWKSWERAKYDGTLVEVIAGGRKDFRGARECRVLTGPMKGQEMWWRDDHMEPVDDEPRTIPTGGDW